MNTYILKLTSAIVIEGVVCRAGEIVEVSETEAKNFLARGKAELYTEENADTDVEAIDVEAIDAEAIDAAAIDVELDDLDLEKMTKAQLLELAEQAGIEADDRMTKAQIIEALNEAQEGGE